jgi:3-oxoacyl-[acyl-carrier protein] reductase
VIAVVTGASRGIGKACAEVLANEGAQLGLCALSRPPEVPKFGGPHFADVCDVRDARQVDKFFATIVQRLGLPDVVVLNAGVVARAPLEKTTEAEWDRVIDTNLKSAFLCARAVWDGMLDRGSGRLIAIGSISGTLGTPQSAPYNASKWGLTGLMKSLAEEGRERRIFCATVLPTGVDTDMIRQGPFQPQMKAEDVARIVRFLAVEAPLAMTGSAVEVFG